MWCRPTVKREIDEELRFHLEMRVAENLAAGMPPEEAAREARKDFGNLQSVREECRDARGASFGEGTLRDIRFGLRMLGRHPGSTLLVVLILALGIGGNTAIFSVVDKAVLNPIPVADADRLVTMNEVDRMHDGRWPISPPLFAELASHTNVFSAIAAYEQGGAELKLVRDGVTLRFSGAVTTPLFFSLLGAKPQAGRLFLPQDGAPGADPVIVLSHRCWQQHFGGDPGLIGRTLAFEGKSCTVIGIAPPTFQFPRSLVNGQFWLPHSFSPEERTNPDYVRYRFWIPVARLREGVTMEQASAWLGTVAQRRESEYPEPQRKWIIEAQPARTMFVDSVLRQTLWSLLVAMLALLLIACANVGSLLVSRALARQGEFSIRLAMGGSGWRVARQVMIECMILAGLAGLFGVFFSWSSIRALNYFYLGELRQLRGVDLDGSVLALTALVSVLASIGFGIAPVWLVSGLRLNDTLKDAAQQQTGGLLARFFQDGLVVVQVSLAVVLLTGSGLLIQSMLRLLRVDPGLDPKGLCRLEFDTETLCQMSNISHQKLNEMGMTAEEWLTAHRQRVRQWQELLLERLRTVPGIDSAAEGGYAGSSWSEMDFRVDGREDLVNLQPNYVGIRGGDFFRTARIALIQGRLLTAADCSPGEQAVVINQALARLCWPGRSPLGERIRGTDKDYPRDYRVVGVVKDLLDWRLDRPQLPTFYCPAGRNDEQTVEGAFMVRSSLDPGVLRETATRIGREMSPATEVIYFNNVESSLRNSTAGRRVYMWLLNALALLGLALSALGVYAVTACAVARRTKEIGVRMALGASRGDIARLVMGRNARLVLNGIVLGVVTALVLTRMIESLIYEAQTGGPWAYIGVVLTLGTSVFMASYLPARHAMRVDPMEALRHE